MERLKSVEKCSCCSDMPRGNTMVADDSIALVPENKATILHSFHESIGNQRGVSCAKAEIRD